MNNTFVGIPMAGNFRYRGEININGKNIIYKKGNLLYLKEKGGDILLDPIDNNSNLVIQNFSSYDIEENESIYEIKKNGNVLVIVLYSFKNIKRIELPSEKLHFYMDRLLKNEIETNAGIQNEVKFMSDEFINNKSLFVIEDYRGKTTKYFDLYGNTWRANCERERPGVYRIRKLNRYRTNNKRDQITQLYGYIEFVTFDEAIKIRGNEFNYTEIKTNEIFKAWDEYISFERALYDEEIKSKGFLKYKKCIVEGDEIVLSFDNSSLSKSALFIDSETYEYDLVNLENNNSASLTIDEILKFKGESNSNSLWLGKCRNESFLYGNARFDFPSKGPIPPENGIIILSDRSLKIQHKRRQKVMRIIEEKKNQTVNMLMRLSAGEKDTQGGGREEPVTAAVLQEMLGKPDVKITENYREAMSIALNTPDIALIQGPPGTGKTTLIKGIIARLNSKGNKNYKILVSSEQHEALFNVVGKLSVNSLIPPFVSSKKYASAGEIDDETQINQNVEVFQNSLLCLCDDLINTGKTTNKYSDYLMKIIYYLQEIKLADYSIHSVRERIEGIRESIIHMNLLEPLHPILLEIYTEIDVRREEVPYKPTEATEHQQRISLKINAQRLTEESFFEDDGFYQLGELQRLLKKYKYDEILLQDDILKEINSNDSSRKREGLELYANYINLLKEKILPTSSGMFDKPSSSLSELIDGLSEKIRVLSKTRQKNIFDIVEEFRYRLLDLDNATEIIKKYTNIVGSTCAQSERSLEATELKEGKYDYVIIDEAARANPLDLMLPLLLGIKVILVGDHMQLPHYVETQYIRKFQEDKGKYKTYDTNLLQKSLFEVIYESVEKSYLEGGLSFKRHITIQEQHRMHPTIGNFISEQFYGGVITNGEGTYNHLNDYDVYNAKNMVWIDTPIINGREDSQTSYFRVCEAEQVMETIGTLVRNNSGRCLKIGVMSFYKAQVALISVMLQDNFPEEIRENIECNTVDSLQGKEFDIVILSTTRSNSEQIASKSLGFIHYSKSRVNVALSRARRLLIIIGDANTMQRNEVFYRLIDYIKKEGHYE